MLPPGDHGPHAEAHDQVPHEPGAHAAPYHGDQVPHVTLGGPHAQDVETYQVPRDPVSHHPEPQRGAYNTNGQVNASARLIRIFLGEPGKLAIPLSIYSGVSSGNFSGQQNLGLRSNEQLINGFINPLSGLVNFSFEGKIVFGHKMQLTSAGFLYQSGFRVMTGYKVGPPGDPLTGRPINFFNSYGSGGIYFQTGAWEKNDSGNMGIFWMAARYIGCYSTPKSLRDVIPGMSSGFYHGWSFGGGIEINNLVNVKVIYYKYIREPEFGYVLPICQFSFHYALRP